MPTPGLHAMLAQAPHKENTLTQDTLQEQTILRDLGDGLILRKATSQDRERLADFHANTLLEIGQTEPDMGLHAWMLDLMSGGHPTFRPGDFTIVEDTTAGKIVSSIGHISQVDLRGYPLQVRPARDCQHRPRLPQARAGARPIR